MVGRLSWLVSAAIVLSTHLMWGCRSLVPLPRQHHQSSRITTEQQRVSVATDDSVIGRQHLRPLREYMDEIVRRQIAIEARLDTITYLVSTLRQYLDKPQKQSSLPPIPLDTVVAGAPHEGDRNLPSLQRSAGVILPDSGTMEEQLRARLPSPRRTRTKVTRQVPASPIVQHFTSSDLHTVEKKLKGGTAPRISSDGVERRLLDSAIALLRSGRYREANALLSSLIDRRSPRQGEYYYWRALTHFLQHQSDDALRDAEAGWKLLSSTTEVPIRADLQYLLAELYSERGDSQRARSYLRAIIEQFPRSDAAILARRKLQQLTAAK